MDNTTPGFSRREVFRRTTAVAATLLAPRLSAQAPAFPWEEATVHQLQEAMKRGELTAEALCQAYLERIEAVNGSLRAVMEVNREALDLARARDVERRQGRVRSPLHGIPVLLKDNIATADAMETTAGSLALVGHKPPRDALLVERLRAAGAVILGKTNLSEWANFRSTRSTSGWSGRGGQCANPYALDRNPCGSSSGTAAAISANLGALGVGTETDGSIVCPSHACGLVGVKPTLGLVSRSGIVPIAASQDTAGPMTRTVEDAALLLTFLAGRDPQDPATWAAPAGVDYTKYLRPGALKGARLGVARRKLTGYHPGTDQVFAAALEALGEAGAVLIDPAHIPHLGEYDDAEFEVLLYEFKDNVERYLAQWAPTCPHRRLTDLISFNEKNREQEMPFFGQEIFEMAAQKGPLTEKAYLRARRKCERLAKKEGLEAVFRKFQLDALVAPTGAPAWVTDLVNGDHYLGGSSTPAAVAGYPSVTVPAGFVHGLPVGISFVGKPWQEGKLLALAFAFQQLTRARKPPRLLPTLPLSS